MADISTPRRGSIAFHHRSRVPSLKASIRNWPDGHADAPRVQGFAGYKAGMTHALLQNTNTGSVTAGVEIQIPVTVVETPPIVVAGVRVYERASVGVSCLSEVWAEKPAKGLERRVPLPEKGKENWTRVEGVKKRVEEVRLIVHTQPDLVTGIPKKAPDILELRVTGGSVEQRLAFAKERLGKELKFTDFAGTGKYVDVVSVTKGKGFQGHVKRFGVKLLTHKNSKHRRMIGTLGPHFPSYVTFRVPQGGQMGCHQRTEYNKLILKYGEKGEEISPAGGFLHYGLVRNPYVLIHGSLPGPSKRLVKFRDPARPPVKSFDKIELTYVSVASRQ